MLERRKSRKLINWNQVYYFSEIASAGSIKTAAKRLNLSASTLSEQLGQLEKDLDVDLFQRQHRKLQLTSDGARLYNSARQTFEAGKRFIDMISPAPLGSYPISVGIVPTAAFAIANKFIVRYLKQNTDISANILRFQHDHLEKGLADGSISFGFTDRKSERKDVLQATVLSTELSFFVSEALPKMTLQEYLQDMPLVICRSDKNAPSATEELLNTLDISSKNTILSEYPSVVESLCSDGVGVCVFGRVHFEGRRDVQMVSLPKDFPALTEKLYVSWAAHAEKNEAIVRLREILAKSKN